MKNSARVLRVYGLGSRVPEETTLETLVALNDGPAFASCDATQWRWLRSQCEGLRRANSPEAVISAVRRDGAARVAIAGDFPLTTPFGVRLLALAKKAGFTVRITPSVSPVGSAYARAQYCLGGDYGYQGLQFCPAKRFLADPSLREPTLPLVIYGVAKPDRKRLAALLPKTIRRYGETILVPPAVAPAIPDEDLRP